MTRVELYKAPDGWRWRAKSGNHRVVGSSEEAHRAKWYARRKALRQFPGAEVVTIID